MLWALAIDHRSSFRTQFLGLHRPFTPNEDQQVRRAKALALDALLAAIDQGLPAGQPALLVDEQYGAEVIERARETGITVIAPVERSGRDELAFEHGDAGLPATIERIDPAYVKVLVRYNPSGRPDVNSRQRARLLWMQDWLDHHGRDWILELLVPPAHREQAVEGLDRARWDIETRPVRTIEAIDELAGSGLHPAYWKLEGMPTSAAYEGVAEATRAAGRPEAGCLVLGRGADTAAVERWLQLAAPLPAYRGFAVGRTLWWDPLKAVLAGACQERDAVDRIATNYRHLVDLYLAATHTRGNSPPRAFWRQ